MRTQSQIALAFGALSLSVGGTAEARPSFPDRIPNVAPVANRCNTCHTRGGGTPRNVFGLDVEANLDPRGIADWSAVCQLDSDNDGLSNGVELADPRCTWTFGQARPMGTVSNPADPNDPGMGSMDAGMPDVPPPEDAGPMDTGPMDNGFMDVRPFDDAMVMDAMAPVDSGEIVDQGTGGGPGGAADAGTAAADTGAPVPTIPEEVDDVSDCTCVTPSDAPRPFAFALVLGAPLVVRSLRRRRRAA